MNLVFLKHNFDVFPIYFCDSPFLLIYLFVLNKLLSLFKKWTIEICVCENAVLKTPILFYFIFNSYFSDYLRQK